MKRICSALALGLLASLTAGGTALAGEPDAGRQEAILSLVQDVCAGCHSADLSGGVGPALTPEALKGKDAAALAETILDGRPDTQMAPFAGMLTQDEAEWLARELQSGITR